MTYPGPGPAPNGQPPHQHQHQAPGPNHPPGAYGPPPGGCPPGLFPPGPPPNGGRGKKTVYLVFGAALALVLVLSGVVLIATGAFDSDEAPAIEAATGGTGEDSQSPTDAPSDNASDNASETPSEEASDEAELSEGASYALLDDVCEVIRPQVETYITIDEGETEAVRQEFSGGGSECYMQAEMEAGEFSSPSFTVMQYADRQHPEVIAGNYEYNVGNISGSCTVTEGVEGSWEDAVFFYGSQDDGCAFLGYTHTLLVHDGNLFIKAEIIYGDEASDGTAELAVLTGLAEAIVEASAQ